MEKALLRHFQDALKDKFIDILINDGTQLLTVDLSDVLTYLFETYSKVLSDIVTEKVTSICAMNFYPSDSILTITALIEKLKQLAKDAKISKIEEQLVDIGLCIIWNTRDFEDGLRTCYQKSDADYNWLSLRKYFKKSQLEMKRVWGPTMLQAGYHQENTLAENLRKDIL